MSYVIAIWDQPAALPLPGDLKAAGELVRMLRRIAPGPNPKYVELIRLLTSRYPDICSPEAEEIAEEQLAWTDGPLSGDSPGAIFNLGIRSEKLDTVRPFVIQTAASLGLHVYDEQAAEACFADGTKVSKGDRRPTDIAPMIFERLAPFMARHGYEALPEKRHFLKKFADGWHLIPCFVAESWPPRYVFSFDPSHDFWLVARLYKEISNPGSPWEPRYDDGPSVILYQQRWLHARGGHRFIADNGNFTVRNAAELDLAIPFIQQKFEQHLFPILDRCQSLAGYEAALNQGAVRDSIFFIEDFFHGYERGWRNVLAAFLTRNPRLEQICAEIEEKLGDDAGWTTAYTNTRRCILYARMGGRLPLS